MTRQSKQIPTIRRARRHSHDVAADARQRQAAHYTSATPGIAYEAELKRPDFARPHLIEDARLLSRRGRFATSNGHARVIADERRHSAPDERQAAAPRSSGRRTRPRVRWSRQKAGRLGAGQEKCSRSSLVIIFSFPRQLSSRARPSAVDWPPCRARYAAASSLGTPHAMTRSRSRYIHRAARAASAPRHTGTSMSASFRKRAISPMATSQQEQAAPPRAFFYGGRRPRLGGGVFEVFRVSLFAGCSRRSASRAFYAPFIIAAKRASYVAEHIDI